MTSRRWSTLVSGLVFAVVLGTAGSVRAQFGFEGMVGPGWGGQYGATYGSAVGFGFSPYGYGSYGGVGYGGYSGGYGYGGFPMPGFDQALGLVPQTTTAFPGLSYGVTAVPGWDGPRWSGPSRGGPRYRVRRRR